MMISANRSESSCTSYGVKLCDDMRFKHTHNLARPLDNDERHRGAALTMIIIHSEILLTTGNQTHKHAKFTRMLYRVHTMVTAR